MEIKVPDYEGAAHAFHRGELTVGNKIFTAFSKIEADQPTENEGVPGTRPFPIADTEGTMDLGAGTITWTLESERVRFIKTLHELSGNKGYRSVKWSLMWILRAKGADDIKKECFGCRQLSEPMSDEYGAGAVGGDSTFSFMAMSINGMFPHEGMTSPTSPG
jgi:hypothetical protein